jgi:DNA-binding NarL/FixJ family response regulator
MDKHGFLWDEIDLASAGAAAPEYTLLDFMGRLLAAFQGERTKLANPKSHGSLKTSLSSHFRSVLSKLEFVALELLVEGKSVKELAAILMISANTTKSRVKTIYSKLEMHKREDLLRYADEMNLFNRAM